MWHPLASDRPCTILQYADDTLIVARADVQAVERLKELLTSFSKATGLNINYNKSMLVPMHVPQDVATQFVGVLGCAQGDFPRRTLVSHSPMRSSISLPLRQLLRGLTGTYLDGGLASSTTVAALS